MIDPLKELLNSTDEELVKQGLHLLLSLEVEKVVADKTFKSALLYSKPHQLMWSVKRFSLLFKGMIEANNQRLLEAAFLALLKKTGRLRKINYPLILSLNPYFDEFDLLSDLSGISALELRGFKNQHIQLILESNPCIKHLVLRGRSTLNLNDLISRFPQLDSLVLESIDLNALSLYVDDERVLACLEKGINRTKLHRTLIPFTDHFDLGQHEQRWREVLQWVRFDQFKSVKDIHFKMVYCPSGRSISIESGREYRVKPGLWMAQTPVSQELWMAIMKENPSYFKGSNRPVEQVTWFESVRFCNLLSQHEQLMCAYSLVNSSTPQRPTVYLNLEANGYRLPFECEWEYCASAGDDLIYSGSNQSFEVGWEQRNSNDQTHPMADLKPNTWGLYDLSGNVWEFCNDAYQQNDVDPYKYTPSNQVKRSMRGGSFLSSIHISNQGKYDPFRRHASIGLRVVRRENL